MTPTCVCCGRPTPDGYACVRCAVDRPRAQLAEIADLTPAARDVAHRQSRRGGGAASGKPGSSLPLDLGGTARLDGVQNALTTWARHIREIRGAQMPRLPAVRPMIGPTCARPYSCDHGSCQALRKPLEPFDEIAFVARWLAGQCEWMRHRPEVDEWLTDLEACARVVRGLVDTKPERRLMGMCTCGRILYAPQHRTETTCPDCDTTWDVDQFRQVLRDQLDERLVTAAEAAHLGGYLDTDRSVKQIRALIDAGATRHRLEARGEVLIKHKHRPGCESGCVQAIDRIATYRFGDIGDLVASTPRRAARAAEMGA